MRLGYCSMEPCLLFHPPLIIQITLQCNRYGVQDVRTLLKERAGRGGSSEQGKTGDVPGIRGRTFFDASHLKLSRHPNAAITF